MANELTYNFPLKSDAYAAFDAISLRNLIIQRLNDQGLITDQNYLGSNVASIIDIVSYAFNTLIFYLNKTSNESIFTEAQLYENINRIVKLLDYKPIGYQTSILSFRANTGDGVGLTRGVYTIPRYSYLSVGSAIFSFNQDITFTISQDQAPSLDLTDLSNKVLLYQGSYREYPVQVATGEKNEVLTLNTPNTLVDHFNLDVYVWEVNQAKWVQYKEVQTTYGQQSFSRIFEKRLNSNYSYEITFGDGITGKKLTSGDKIAIFYLQSSGLNGVIGPNALEGQAGNKAQGILYNSSLYREIIADVNQERYVYITGTQLAKLGFSNEVGSTIPKDVEDADSIRKNAPTAFKTQYRLVSQEDYETHIRNNFSNFVSDVKVFSNWDYTSKYLKYFYDLNLNPGGFRQVILNQVLYADSCNFNNVYICAIPRVSEGSTLKYLLPSQKEAIISTANVLKTLTVELTFLDPIYKAIHFGTTAVGQTTTIPDANTFYIEVQKHPNSLRSGKSIQMEIAKIFKDFFDLSNAKLGAKFNYALLQSKVLSVEGVMKIVTKNTIDNLSFDGLSFFMWNPVYPDLDKQTIYNNVSLLEFEIVYFEGLSNIETKINVV